MKNIWPFQSECKTFYGDPTQNYNVWAHNNLSLIVPPFFMEYYGDNGKIIPIHAFNIHKKCIDSLERIFDEIWKASNFNQATIDAWHVSHFSGSAVSRTMRNSKKLSMHAFGCALDMDALNKPMGTTNRFPWQVTNAFQNEGWINLVHDPMHFQAARLG